MSAAESDRRYKKSEAGKAVRRRHRQTYKHTAVFKRQRKRTRHNYIRRARQMITAIKTEGRCCDCGGQFPPECMDFDHRDRTTKRLAVSRLTSCATINKIMQEVAQCDLVCANCHRIRTVARRDHIPLPALERERAVDAAQLKLSIFDSSDTSEKP